MEYEMISPADVQECKRLLVAAAERENQRIVYSDYGDEPGNEMFEFTLRSRTTLYRNTWSPTFYGVLDKHSEGTWIHGEFRAHSAVQAFMGIWFLLISLAFAPSIIQGIGEGLQHGFTQNLLFGGCIVLAMPVSVIVIFVIGRLVLGGLEESTVLEFLNDTFGE